MDRVDRFERGRKEGKVQKGEKVDKVVVVRNPTKKYSSFKIQAQKSKFQEHLLEFSSSRLLTNHSECAKYEEYLKDLTQKFVQLSFDAPDKSPFLQGMNYNGKHYGFHYNSHSFSYKQWLPDIVSAELEGPCNKEQRKRFALEPCGNDFFQLTVEEHFQTFADGDTVRLILTDKHGKVFTCAPPSCRRTYFDKLTGQTLGVYVRRDSIKVIESVMPPASLMALTVNIHQDSLEKLIERVAEIRQCHFNTIIIDGLFDDKEQKSSLLNKFSLKITDSELDLLEKFIDELLQQKFKVLFKIDLQYQKYVASSSLQNAYLKTEGSFQFDLDKLHTVVPFLLAHFSFLMSHFSIDGFQLSNIDKVLIATDKEEKYGQLNCFHDTFYEDCSTSGILFIKFINLLIQRHNSESVSYCSTNCLVPGAYLPLVEGGLGFNYCSPIEDSRDSSRTSILQSNIKNQLYYNVVRSAMDLKTCLDELDTLLDLFWHPSGGVCTNCKVLDILSTKQFIRHILEFREKDQYFIQNSTVLKDSTHDKGVLVFNRNKYVFIVNTTAERQEALFKPSTTAQPIFYSKASEAQNTGITYLNGQLDVVVSPMTAIVLEKERIS